MAPRPRAPPHCKQVSRGTSSVERRDHPCQHGGPRHSHMMLPKKRSARPCETMRHGRSGLAAHTVSPPSGAAPLPHFFLFYLVVLAPAAPWFCGEAPLRPRERRHAPPFVRCRGTHGTVFFLRGDDPPRPALTAQHTAPLRTTAPSVCSRATLLVGGATVVVCHAPVTNGDGR